MFQRRGDEENEEKVLDVWAEVLTGATPGAERASRRDEAAEEWTAAEGLGLEASHKLCFADSCKWAHAHLTAGARDAQARALRWVLSADAHEIRAEPLGRPMGAGRVGGAGRREARGNSPN